LVAGQDDVRVSHAVLHFSHDHYDPLDNIILKSGLMALEYPIMGEGDYGYEFKKSVTPEEWEALWLALKEQDPNAA
jgi:hypothetical protein